MRPRLIGVLILVGTLTASFARAQEASPATPRTGNIPAREVSPRGLTNLAAFARLAAYVRFFHPSDQAAKADWDRAYLAGVQAVEPAVNDAELAAALSAQFAPIAPSVQIWAGANTDAPPPIAPPAKDAVKSLVGWRHNGVQLGKANAPSAYSSKRLRAQPDEPATSLRIAPAGTIVERELAPGVWCRVPVTLAVTEDGTWPAPTATDAVIPPRPEGWTPSGDDRATRLADICIAWGVFQHFYPYWDAGSHAPGICGVDRAAWLTDALRDAADDPDARAFTNTLARFVARLDDGHGNAWHATRRPEKVLPIGWTWAADASGGPPALVVFAVLAGQGEAVRRGDRVVTINDRPVEEWYREASTRISAAHEGWRRYRALQLIASDAVAERGQAKLDLERAGGGGTTVLVDAVAYSSAFERLTEPRPANGAEVAPGVRYVNLNGLKQPAWDAMLDDLVAAKAVIFEARGYPDDAGMLALQHLADQPIQSARWNIPIVTLPDGEGWSWNPGGRWNLMPLEPRLGGNGQRIVYVTDGRAISYAESCLAIVEAYHLGEIVGSTTAATNGNVNPLSLPGGYSVMWTGMKVLRHDGTPHHGVGVRPTVPIEPTIAGIAAGRDEVLEKAVEIATRADAPAPK